jgi:hypothetical protein
MHQKKSTAFLALTWMPYPTWFLQSGFKHGYDKACYTNTTGETITHPEHLLLNGHVLIKCENVI